MPMPRAMVTPRLTRDARRATILRGAARAFAAGGFAATSMDTIAAETGITKLIVYRHFESKEELYRQVLSCVVETILEAERDGDETGGSGDAHTGAALHAGALLHAARTDPDGFRLLFRHAAREPEFAAFASRVQERAVHLARALVAPHLPDATLHGWASETIVQFLVAATLTWLEKGDKSRDEDFVRLVTASLRALVRTWASPDTLESPNLDAIPEVPA